MNIGWKLSQVAAERPEQVAVVEPQARDAQGSRSYASISFAELDARSSRVAAGLRDFGVQPGMRLALLVRPGIDFVTLVFALFKAGVVTILIDPGMGRKNMLRCLQESEPEGFVAIPLAQAVRVWKRSLFPKARFNVTVGRRWFWGGRTLGQLQATSRGLAEQDASEQDPAAIIFTTGSTGPPKGVLYRHGNFAHQVEQIQSRYNITPGEIDLPGFPLFALFNSAMGVTTVFPEMDFTRPADVCPQTIVEHVRDWQPTQSFGSPALWNTVGTACERSGQKLETVRRVLSAGAPVPPHVLERVRGTIAADGEIYTPYGATEALPVASISATEVLGETAMQSARGAGTCVGSRFSGIAWQTIAISDEPLATIDQVRTLPPGEIGELIVRGPVVTTEYVTRTEANALAKIRDGDGFWHRMGDCGYLDETDRFWFCGRKSHRVQASHGTLFTVPCEAIACGHEAVYRARARGGGGEEHEAARNALRDVAGSASARDRGRTAVTRRSPCVAFAERADGHDWTGVCLAAPLVSRGHPAQRQDLSRAVRPLGPGAAPREGGGVLSIQPYTSAAACCVSGNASRAGKTIRYAVAAE